MSAVWNYDWTGKSFLIKQRPVKVDEQLSEVLDDRLGVRHVLTHVHNTTTGECLMLKIRHGLNPEHFDFEDPEETERIARSHFLHEVDTAKLVGNIGHGPKYHARVRQRQGRDRGGTLYFLLMGDVPGEDVDDLLDDVSAAQLASIRNQLAFILENMRLGGHILIDQHPSFLRYDNKEDKLYLVDLAFIGFTDPNSETSVAIGEHSIWVEAFNIWPPPHAAPAPQRSGQGTSRENPSTAQDRGTGRASHGRSLAHRPRPGGSRAPETRLPRGPQNQENIPPSASYAPANRALGGSPSRASPTVTHVGPTSFQINEHQPAQQTPMTTSAAFPSPMTASSPTMARSMYPAATQGGGEPFMPGTLASGLSLGPQNQNNITASPLYTPVNRALGLS